MEPSLQQRYAPKNQCFGCGPANPQGLRIESRVEGDTVVCDFVPSPHHLAFPGVVNGGIIGVVFDCHCNWTAAHALMKASGQDSVPPTVTAEYAVTLKRPTRMDAPMHVVARVVAVEGRKATIEATLESAGKLTATCRGVFVAVEEGHPAFFRW